jgi:hypothetical protein
MKEKELRELATCSLCDKKIGETGLPLFYKLTVERFGLDLNACRRRMGLDLMIGSPVLAMAFSPDEDLAQSLHGPVTYSVCELCSQKNPAVMHAIEIEQTERAK